MTDYSEYNTYEDVRINGMRLIIAPPIVIPKVTLSDNVVVSDNFRKEIDKWLLQFFGIERIEQIVKDDEFINVPPSQFGEGYILVSRKRFEMIKQMQMKQELYENH